MFNADDLFKQRFSAYLKETSRYLRYIFNGHIAVVIFFLISAMAVYYQRWLAELPADFPTSWIIGILFGVLASYTPVRTLLQEPDLVFLLPAEHKMEPYFRKALILSFGQNMLPTLFLVAALSPLYLQAFPHRGGKMYLLSFIVLLIFKVGNVIATWWMLKVREQNVRRIDQLVRFVLNCTIFYFIIRGHLLFASLVTILFVLLFLYDWHYARKRVGVAWDILVASDLHRMQTFYRIANLFTDVPHMKNRVKKRPWLSFLIHQVPFAKQHTYDYVYRIAFIRSGDYFGMYVRLAIIGGLLIYVIPTAWMKLIFALLFLYLSSFQMITLYQHFRTNIWFDLYPVAIEQRRQSVMQLLVKLAAIQVLLFTVLFVVQGLWLWSLGMLASGAVFMMLFFMGYVRRKLTTI